MKNTQFALFMVLNGRATEALTFYQEAFAGDILFKITNQEFKAFKSFFDHSRWRRTLAFSLDFTNGHFSITTS